MRRKFERKSRSSVSAPKRTMAAPEKRSAVMLNEQKYWQAVLDKDADSDGRFVYGVATTGVYCRPTCPSRRPLRKNVRFFATSAEAESAGFRACRRCRPSSEATNVITSVVH